MPSHAAPPLAWAIWYAALGIPLVPGHEVLPGGACSCQDGPRCGSAGKHPRITGWQQTATTDPTQIRAWWRQWPSANPMTATGRLFDVLDRDCPDHEAWQAQTGFTIPNTWNWRTGSGGSQFAFQPALGLGNAVKRVPFADTRAKGGLAVLPPSRNRKGAYAWITPPGSVPLAPWPADLLAALTPPSMPPPSLAPRPAGIVTTIPASLTRWAERGAALGQQTHAAFWLACRLRQHGADEHEGWAILERFAAACVPPADLTKLARIWRDSSKYQGYEPGRELAQSLTLVHRGATLPSAAYRVGRPI